MTVLVDGKYYEDATYNTQFISVMNGQAVPVPDEVPDPKEADNGKILKVVEGAAAWADAPVELPVSEVADNGKVLTVVEGAPAWQEPTHPAQFVIATTAPTDTTVPWIDITSATSPVLKVYITDTWVAVVDTVA